MSTKHILTQPMDMSPSEIGIAMIQAGITQSEIARDEQVSQNAVHLVIEGKGVSDRIRKRIAERIGIDIKRIWPSTYMNGGPFGRGRPVSGSRRKAA
jgi:lambda repressor-like predicted transcriptional regulator